ncbi:MAG: DUF4956 domain-containing protein [Bacteroides sp.]|nr:DUF4956 domain-containing protein [Bacteroides sp.]MCM1447103.1 DUF4956 domain-containing protein [Bacteroides sp.]
MDEFDGLAQDFTPLFEAWDFFSMVGRFAFNTLMVWMMIHLLYYPKSKRRDYYFTFMLISISIFMMLYLLGGVKLKVGFALGLFAIFGIIRYRTESMPVREMTYLFSIISMSVINALSLTVSYAELVFTNFVFIAAAWILESYVFIKHVSTKLIQYDRIALITPDKREELLLDLRQRTGLNIIKVEIGALDFLRDMAIVKIYYEMDEYENNSEISNQLKLPKEEWTEVRK